MPLIDKRKEVAPELKNIFKSWFIRFSQDRSHEQILDVIKNNRDEEEVNRVTEILTKYPDPLRTMTREDCFHFVKAIAGVQDMDLRNYRISNLFDAHCHTIENDFLLAEEFLTFYESQTKTKQETVRTNLS